MAVSWPVDHGLTAFRLGEIGVSLVEINPYGSAHHKGNAGQSNRRCGRRSYYWKGIKMSDKGNYRIIEFAQNWAEELKAEIDKLNDINNFPSPLTVAGNYSISIGCINALIREFKRVVRERDDAQHEASRLHECRDTWKNQAESLATKTGNPILGMAQ